MSKPVRVDGLASPKHRISEDDLRSLPINSSFSTEKEIAPIDEDDSHKNSPSYREKDLLFNEEDDCLKKPLVYRGKELPPTPLSEKFILISPSFDEVFSFHVAFFSFTDREKHRLKASLRTQLLIVVTQTSPKRQKRT
jgi:hypothetical protein